MFELWLQGTNLFFHIKKPCPYSTHTPLQSNSVFLIIKIYVCLQGRNGILSFFKGVSSLYVSLHQSRRISEVGCCWEDKWHFMIWRPLQTCSSGWQNVKSRWSVQRWPSCGWSCNLDLTCTKTQERLSSLSQVCPPFLQAFLNASSHFFRRCLMLSSIWPDL